MENSNIEIDNLIGMVNPDPYGPIDELIAIGEPALYRLLQAMDGTILIPLGDHPIDAIKNRQTALSRLARPSVPPISVTYC